MLQDRNLYYRTGKQDIPHEIHLGIVGFQQAPKENWKGGFRYK